MKNEKMKISDLDSNNPLFKEDLNKHKINFNELKPYHFAQAIDTLIPLAIKENEELLKDVSYDDFFEMGYYAKHLSLVVAFLSMLNMNSKTKEIQNVYEDKMLDYIKFCDDVRLDTRLYNKAINYENSANYSNLTEVKKKILKDYIKMLKRNGVNLNNNKKEELKKLGVELNELFIMFDNNLIKTEQEMKLSFKIEELKGLSQRALLNFEKDINGNYIGDYISDNLTDILNDGEIESARKKTYDLIRKRGVWKEYNNKEIIKNIISLFHKEANILGYDNYSEYKMSINMVENSKKALDFINDLGEKALVKARKEIEEINKFSYLKLNKPIEYHNLSYLINKLKNEKYSINTEEQRKFFPISKVLDGLFDLVNGLFGIKFIKDDTISVWDEDVIAFNVYENNQKIGLLFLDLFSREEKEQGAYMSGIISHHINERTKEKTLPVSHIVLNLAKMEEEETTLKFNDVVTLFHEMGHALHHLLTKVENSYFSGINGVQLDAVELPSQFMENFCLDYEVLKKISCHTETGEPFSMEEYKKIKDSRDFLSGYSMLRQIVLAEIDIRAYSEPNKCPLEIEKEVREKWKVLNVDLENMILPSFSHVVSFGYNAGYYSYLWAEVMSMDAFNALKEVGESYQAQKEIAQKFRECILEVGGVDSMIDNFIKFRGREPEISYLLKSYNI